MRSHQWIDERSLALHVRVASRVAADPALLARARANLAHWLRTNPSAALEEWRDLLDNTPLPDLLRLMCSRSETAARLRQSSPFAGLLPADERQAILDEYAARRA